MAEPNEFQIDIQIDTIESAKKALQFKEDEKKRYLMNIVDNHPYITVYHKAGPSWQIAVILIIFAHLACDSSKQWTLFQFTEKIDVRTRRKTLHDKLSKGLQPLWTGNIS